MVVDSGTEIDGEFLQGSVVALELKGPTSRAARLSSDGEQAYERSRQAEAGARCPAQRA